MPVHGKQEAGKAKDQLAGDVFSEHELQNIRDAIRKKYMTVSGSAEGMFRYPTGRDGALALGYDEERISGISAELMNAFCGVGNPFGIDPVKPGSAVLDIGCGAGFDLIVAARLVGETGRVCGLDMTPEMLERSSRNFTELGIDTIETALVDSEKIPYDDNSFDLIISNGVINLSARKLELFREMFRVLKPGGKVQFADIVLEKELPAAMAGNLDAWAQ
jgi:SAM-dependent methyltransferase